MLRFVSNLVSKHCGAEHESSYLGWMMDAIEPLNASLVLDNSLMSHSFISNTKKSSYKLKMASIPTLPTELLDQIANESLDQDDLLALRSTCKILNRKLQEAHLNSIFSCRRVFLIPDSLENLIKISKHPSGANLRVRKIIISKFIPYTKPYPKTEWKYKGLNCQKTITNTIIKTTDAHSDEVSDFYENNKYVVLLTIAFSNLPNIKALSFEFEDFEDLTRSEINLIYPNLGYGPGVHGDGASKAHVHDLSRFIAENTSDWYEFEEQSPASEDILSLVLYIAVATGIKGIERIDDADGDWSGLQKDQIVLKLSYLKPFVSTFSNLRTLHLTIQIENNSTASFRFKQWIQAIGLNLEDLRIWNPSYADQSNPPVLLPAGKLTKLKIIQFWNFNFEIDDFITFINGSMELRLLKLERCRFHDQIEDWYRLLRYLRRNHCALRKIVTHTEFEGNSFDGTRVTDLNITSSPGSEETVFQVETRSGRGGFGERTLGLKLDDQQGAVEFWDTINGITKSK
ncbi:hypothetical protein TWF703_004716 [Orbilia oligospora]|uniref:F-box domain-containing protein n=2 Tax=Orbilia oligospora TaxID=2813651 RepID=A0A7C8NLT2_ORBOL|nr:hypothetical protein TWF703_004716 [Orbilia oligospora]